MKTRKEIGDANQKARAAAMKTLAGMRGQNVTDMKIKELGNLVIVLLQWMGLGDENGNIK
jgi:hypothetical protein